MLSKYIRKLLIVAASGAFAAFWACLAPNVSPATLRAGLAVGAKLDRGYLDWNFDLRWEPAGM